MLGKLALGPSKKAAAAGKLVRVLVRRTAWLVRTLACCRSVWGSSCRTGCGEPMMERCTWGTMGQLGKLGLPGRWVLPGKLAAVAGSLAEAGSSAAAGSFAVEVLAGVRLVARSHRCRLGRKSLSGRAQLRGRPWRRQ